METLPRHIEDLQYTIAVCSVAIFCVLGLVYVAVQRVADEIAKLSISIRLAALTATDKERNS